MLLRGMAVKAASFPIKYLEKGLNDLSAKKRNEIEPATRLSLGWTAAAIMHYLESLSEWWGDNHLLPVAPH